MFQINTNFQTPRIVGDYMARMVIRPRGRNPVVIEPTPGTGQLVEALKARNMNVYAPTGDFWESAHSKISCDYYVMNPPFNPVSDMERFVNHAMEVCDNVIALLPCTYVINSERRLGELMDYGLVSVTSLPRKTFPGCRVQVGIFELKKGYAGTTTFKRFSW